MARLTAGYLYDACLAICVLEMPGLQLWACIVACAIQGVSRTVRELHHACMQHTTGRTLLLLL